MSTGSPCPHLDSGSSAKNIRESLTDPDRFPGALLCYLPLHSGGWRERHERNPAWLGERVHICVCMSVSVQVHLRGSGSLCVCMYVCEM